MPRKSSAAVEAAIAMGQPLTGVPKRLQSLRARTGPIDPRRLENELKHQEAYIEQLAAEMSVIAVKMPAAELRLRQIRALVALNQDEVQTTLAIDEGGLSQVVADANPTAISEAQKRQSELTPPDEAVADQQNQRTCVCGHFESVHNDSTTGCTVAHCDCLCFDVEEEAA